MMCTLGLDISTTASKALLLGEDGTLLGVSSAPHNLSTPRPLWSEQVVLIVFGRSLGRQSPDDFEGITFQRNPALST
ncbi:MAG: hypothetical protein HKN13_08485 [Rhodothermales bacterium]|nr:hypothetical protein [Rhodothermales bacterium]